MAPLLAEIYRRELKPSIITVSASGAPDVVADLSRSLEAFEKAVQPVVAERVMQLSRGIPIKGPDRLTPEEREKIAAATPQKPAATPKASRRLLIYDANIGYGGANGGHRSIPAANMAIELFAKTGAYEAVFSNDLENFKYDKIRKFDAVFLNNTVGQIFVDPEVRAGLSRFVREGGGLAGYHGTSHASMDWPEFGEMLGAVEGSHREPTEMATVKIDDPTSPLVAAFGGKVVCSSGRVLPLRRRPALARQGACADEHGYRKDGFESGQGLRPPVRPSRRRLRAQLDPQLRQRPRLFHGAGPHAGVFYGAESQRLLLQGIQFVLGDLDADTTPSSKRGVSTQRR